VQVETPLRHLGNSAPDLDRVEKAMKAAGAEQLDLLAGDAPQPKSTPTAPEVRTHRICRPGDAGAHWPTTRSPPAGSPFSALLPDEDRQQTCPHCRGASSSSPRPTSGRRARPATPPRSEPEMTIFNTKIGDDEVTVTAPVAGQFSRIAFEQAFPKGGLYGLDVEGTYMGDLGQFDPEFEIRLIQFATEDQAFVLDLADHFQQLAAIDLLADESTWFCSHTPMDVVAVFTRLGADITQRNVDTRVLAKMADPDSLGGLDLKSLATKYAMPQLAEADEILDRKFLELWLAAGGKRNAKKAKGKDEDDHTDSDVARFGWSAIEVTDQDFLVYAGLDAIACRRLLPQLAAATGAPKELLEMEVWLAGQANRIQIRGMVVDREKLDQLSGGAGQVAEQARARVAELTGGLSPLSPKLRPHEENVLAPNGKPLKAEDGLHASTCKKPGCPGCKTAVKQSVQGWLAEHGVDWSTWTGSTTPSGIPSLEKDNINLLSAYDLDEAGRAVVDALIEYRGVHDQLNKTKGVRAGLDQHGRIHPTLKTVEAITGRMSSTGPNFQNFSKKNPELRGMFIPEDGHTLLTADFDQVELRVVAALAREQKMIDTILAGGDLHDLTVAELAAAGITIDRDTAKMTNFLIVYGGGGPALSTQAGIPLDEAREIVASFRGRYPAIQRLSQVMGQQKTVVVNIAGRRIPVGVNKKTGDSRSYANINYLVQSSARELLVHAWHRFATEFGRGDMVWFPIHDELVLQVPNDLVETVMSEIETCMRFDFMGVPISASAVPLVEPSGTSRWMTSKLADKYAEQRRAA
jgi:DNA polymerase-1